MIGQLRVYVQGISLGNFWFAGSDRVNHADQTIARFDPFNLGVFNVNRGLFDAVDPRGLSNVFQANGNR